MKFCQKCKKSPAQIHVTEVPEEPEEPVQHHFCEQCAVQYDLPFEPVEGKLSDNIWKLLHISKQASRRRRVQECPNCKMTLEELRRKGRMGCAHCYEAFARYVSELIERMHGAREHVGQRPHRRGPAPEPETKPVQAPGTDGEESRQDCQHTSNCDSTNRDEVEYASAPPEPSPAQRIQNLQRQLDQAIAEEAYEQAADLRDQLRSLHEAAAEAAPSESESA